MIRVVIADDHHLVRQGIRSLLAQASDITVIGEAADGYEAVELVEQVQPDVLLLDVGMPRLGGIQAAEQIQVRKLATRIVMLSMHTDRQLVRQALRVGANGYVLKNALFEELLLAIHAAVKGHTYLSPEISQLAVDILREGVDKGNDTTPYDQLTPREREVLKLVAEGYTNCEMADILTLSVRTIQKHRASLMAKLDIHDIAGLTRFALKHGLILNED